MIRKITLCLLALVLTSCSQSGSLLRQNEAEQLWLSRQPLLHRVNTWNLQARAAVRVDGGAYNIGIRWNRSTEKSVLLLQAPLGQGVIRIESDAGGFYRLELPDGRELQNTSREALLQQAIGWSIPLSGLEYWIRGLPGPGDRKIRRIDDQGRIRKLEQDGWSIDYSGYIDQVDTPDLPRRIQLNFEEILIKLAIERWQPASYEAPASDLFPEFD